MGTTSPKAVIMDETAVNRAMTRIAHDQGDRGRRRSARQPGHQLLPR